MKLEPRERLLHLFEERIYTDLFKDLSGWDKAAFGLPFPDVSLMLTAKDLRRYIFERELPNDCLEAAKEKLANLSSSRESAHIESDNLLLTPGATAAIAVILHYLRTSAVEVVVVDPPFFFSVKKLCDILGLEFVAVDRSMEELDEHDRIFNLIKRYRHRKKALILTQPRYVVSRDYPLPVLLSLRRALNPDDFMIIDQSVDMEFCSANNFIDLEGGFIKVRTVGKSLSLNGSRLSTIIASREIVPQLNRHASILYGALDIAMLKLGAHIAEPQSFERHLKAVRSLIEEAVRDTRLILSQHPYEVVRPENGYLGYVSVDTSEFGRFTLYQALLRESVHSMFSAHFGLRQLHDKEMIRVNYLLNIREGILVLKEFGDRLCAGNGNGRLAR